VGNLVSVAAPLPAAFWGQAELVACIVHFGRHHDVVNGLRVTNTTSDQPSSPRDLSW
jgi:hypothetical protein